MENKVYDCENCKYRNPDVYFCDCCMVKILEEHYEREIDYVKKPTK